MGGNLGVVGCFAVVCISRHAFWVGCVILMEEIEMDHH